MAIRFRKSFKLAPGVRWNVSGSGSSFSFGPRGFSANVGKRGAYLNTGIPGTGFYSRERIGSSGPKPVQRSSAGTSGASVTMTCGVKDDGTLYFQDAAGAPVAEHLVEIAKKQNKEAILGLIQQKCDEINDQVEALGRLHHDTPDCRKPLRFVPLAFDERPPLQPAMQTAGFVSGLFKSGRDKVERANQVAKSTYEGLKFEWDARRAAHSVEQERRKKFIENDVLHDPGAMEQFLEDNLQEIVWPRETEVSFEIQGDGSKALLDVDLPEVEDMPSKVAAVPARGLKLSIKDMAATKVQKLYLEHAHGILFRLIGETFAALPTVQQVVASGFTQRPSATTGHIQDDYVVSVRVSRVDWDKLDFTRLDAINTIESLGQHEIVRNIQRAGKMLTIEPFTD